MEADVESARTLSTNTKVLEAAKKMDQIIGSLNQSMNFAHLIATTKKVGFSDIKLDVIGMLADDIDKRDPGWVKTKAMLDMIVTKGGMDKAWADETLAALKDANEARDFISVTSSFVVVGTKS